MITDPIALTDAEDALHSWIVSSTGIPGERVRVQQPRDYGEAKGPYPKATISLLTFLPTQQQGRETIPSIVQQRYTVIADGPGTVGVNFYPDASLTPLPISIAAGPGDPPATSAAALLVELQANLPAGYTAIADPDDTASVLVSGSVDEPLFDAAPVDPLFLTVTTTVPRFPVLLHMECYLVWRVEFRADGVSGVGQAANAMNKAQLWRATYLDPRMRSLGFRAAGTPLSAPSVPVDRSESLAVLDSAFFGRLTGAEATKAVRAVGAVLTAA